MGDNGHSTKTATQGGNARVDIQPEPKGPVEVSPVKDKKGFNLSEAVHRTGVIAAKTAAGIGVGAATGIGAVVAISVAEVTVPALLVLKIFGFAGGALGLLSGLSKKK
jgi:hypothetical protein